MASYRKSDEKFQDTLEIGDYTVSFDFSKKKLRIVFMGTPSFAVPVLEGLIQNYEVVMVVCQPDRKKNRRGEVIMPDTKVIALENGILVFQPENIREDYARILAMKPDMIVTCAYGQFIPKEIIDYPKYGCINVHGSLLPSYRGGAPIHWALIHGDKVTGVTIMKTSLKMDAGDVIRMRSTSIEDDENLESLYERLSYLGRDLLLETIPTIVDGTAIYTKQDEEKVTFALNVSKEDERIDFNKSNLEVYNLIRGLSPVPGAYCFLHSKRMKVYQAKIDRHEYKGVPGEIVSVSSDSFTVLCGDGAIKFLDIGLEGKKRCLVKNFLNGVNHNELLGKVLNCEKE